MRLRNNAPQWRVWAAQIAVLIGLTVLLWWSVDWRDSIALLVAADLLWLGTSALALTLQTVLSALRWQITAAQLGIVISKAEAVREYYLSQLVNQSLPGGVIGDASRAVRSREQAGLLASGQAVLFERLAGQLGLLAILVVGLILAVLAPTSVDWPLWLVAPVAETLLMMACLAFGIAFALRVSGRTETALHRFVRMFAHAIVARDVWVKQVALSLGTAICNVAAFAFCATALGVVLPIEAIVVLVPIILFAMVLPLSISGWGFREGAAAALFPVVGASMSEGLATSVAFGLVFLATVLPGMLVSWLRPNAPVPGRRRVTN